MYNVNGIFKYILHPWKLYRFSYQVVASWCVSGFILSCFIYLLDSGASSQGSGLFFGVSIMMVVLSVIFGLLGVLIDKIYGYSSYHRRGIFWYMSPLLTYLQIALLFLMFIIALFGLGINWNPVSTPMFSNSDSEFERFRRKVQNMELQDVLQEFSEELERLYQLESEGKLEPEQERVLGKFKSFDRSKYDKRLRDLFQEEELDDLILILLMLLGGEIR